MFGRNYKFILRRRKVRQTVTSLSLIKTFKNNYFSRTKDRINFIILTLGSK
jgi:hypothetical protein